ncbi:MAG: insulinase family protein [Acidobacteriota bacterium]|nr:insulinase family protein [Acidobacteriota bacterium]
MKKFNSAISCHSSNISFLLFLIICLTTPLFAQEPSETPPPPSAPPQVNVPEVREMTLPNGLKVVAVTRQNVPLVTVSLLIRRGAEQENQTEAGLANTTANLLLKGTEFRTATDIAQQIEFLGGSLNSGADWDSSTVNLNIMSDKLGRALSIMSDSVIRPTFPAKELALLKKQTIDGLNVSLKQPGSLLGYVADRFAYGQHSSNGTPQTIVRINKNDVLDFYNKNYTPENAVLIFTGDISATQAFNFAKLFFSSWEKYKPNNSIINLEFLGGLQSPPRKNSEIINRMLVIDLPDSGQAAVGYATKLKTGRIVCGEKSGNEINCSSSKIYYPASVLNSILGGGYSARLNQEIRLKRGLSYGARSNFDWRGFNSNFIASTQTKNESAAQVAELIKIEIQKLADDSIVEDELIPRKAVVTGGFGRGLQTNNGLAARLRDIYLYGLNPDELNSYMTNVNDVTDSQIKDFASDNLKGGDMIIVGDAKLFMDDLKKRFPNQKIEIIKADNLDLNKDTLRKR